MEQHGSLVEQIKAIQRTNADGRTQWWGYCDEHLAGIKDPKRHDAATLQEFLTKYYAGNFVGTYESKKGSSMRAPGQPTMGMPRSGYVANNNGNNYVVGPGTTYENYYPPMANVYGNSGGPVYSNYPANSGTGSNNLQELNEVSVNQTQNEIGLEMVKEGQRRSENWKQAWQHYCSQVGSPMFDPKKYDDDFITSFVDQVGSLYLKDVGVEPSPVKRAHDTSPSPPSKRQANTRLGWQNQARPSPSPENSQKDMLAKKIKSLQREDAQIKSAWQEYCDETNQGCKDPNRHTEMSLQAFFDKHQIEIDM